MVDASNVSLGKVHGIAALSAQDRMDYSLAPIQPSKTSLGVVVLNHGTDLASLFHSSVSRAGWHAYLAPQPARIEAQRLALSQLNLRLWRHGYSAKRSRGVVQASTHPPTISPLTFGQL